MLNPRALRAQIFGNLPKFASEVRWVPQHPLVMLQVGNKSFSVFILGGGTFFLLLNLKQNEAQRARAESTHKGAN